MSATSNWLDFSANSNLSNPTYMTGFLDISYGNVFLRNSNLFIKSADASLGGRLFVAGDMSLSGRLYAPINSIPANAIIGGGGATFTNTTANFASNNSIVSMTLDTIAANTLDVSGFMSVSQAFGVGVTNPQYQVDVGGGQIGCGRMAQFGTGGAPFSPGNNITTNIIAGQFTGPLSTTADSSLNGRLFVGADSSLNGNLTLGGNLVVNGDFTVKEFTQSSIINTITTNVFNVSEDLSLNGRFFASGDASLNGNLHVGPTVGDAPYVLDIADQNNRIFRLMEYNNNDGAVVRGYRALGTAVAPLAVTADTILTGIRGLGYNSSSLYNRGADIELLSSEAYTGTAGGGYIQFNTASNGTTSVVERMRIAPSGNVGIGTTNPSYKLDVAGQINSNAGGVSFTANNASYNSVGTASAYPTNRFNTIAAGDGVNALFNRSGGNYVAGQGLTLTGQSLTWPGNNSYASQIQIDGGHSPLAHIAHGQIRFYTANVQQMTINESGNVGIGTTNPQATLHVNGALKTNSVTLNGAYYYKRGDDIPGYVPNAGNYTLINPASGYSILTFPRAIRTSTMASLGADNSTLTFNSVGIYQITITFNVVSQGSINQYFSIVATCGSGVNVGYSPCDHSGIYTAPLESAVASGSAVPSVGQYTTVAVVNSTTNATVFFKYQPTANSAGKIKEGAYANLPVTFLMVNYIDTLT